jgi:hypothetical protein
VRVRDDRGGATYANRTIEVGPAAPGPPQVPPTTDEFVLPPPVGRIALDAPRRQRLSVVRRRGFRATVECPAACRIVSSLRISGPAARSLGLGNRARTIARRRRSLSARGFPRLRLKPSRAVRRALALRSSVPAILHVAVTAQGFAPKTYRVPVRIVR